MVHDCTVYVGGDEDGDTFLWMEMIWSEAGWRTLSWILPVSHGVETTSKDQSLCLGWI